MSLLSRHNGFKILQSHIVNIAAYISKHSHPELNAPIRAILFERQQTPTIKKLISNITEKMNKKKKHKSIMNNRIKNTEPTMKNCTPKKHKTTQ